MLIKNKRGLEGPLWILIIAIALLLFLIIYIGVFKGLLGKETKVIEAQIKNVGDSDADGVANIIDECPEQKGPLSNKGCPLNQV